MAVRRHGERGLPCIIENDCLLLNVNRQVRENGVCGGRVSVPCLFSLSGESLQKAGNGQREGLYGPSVMKDK